MEQTLDDAAANYKQAVIEHVKAFARFKEAEAVAGAAGAALTQAERKMGELQFALLNAAKQGATTGTE